MATSDEEIARYRKLLEIVKESGLSRRHFPPEVNQELEALEKELIGTGYDRDFLDEVLRQIAEATETIDGNGALRLRLARSILKTVKSGEELQMLLIVQMITVHCAVMRTGGLMNASKDLEHVAGYGNMFAKLARTFAMQTVALTSNDRKVTVNNVSVGDGGQAIVGDINQSAGGKGQPEATTSPRLVSDQSGSAMPMIEADDEAATIVPRLEPDQEPVPSAGKRKRRR